MPEGKELRVQVYGIHIICGTVWKCSTGRGLSMPSNLIVLIYAYYVLECLNFFIQYYTAVFNLSVETPVVPLVISP